MREFYEDGVERHISQTKTDARIASEEIRRLREENARLRAEAMGAPVRGKDREWRKG